MSQEEKQQFDYYLNNCERQDDSSSDDESSEDENHLPQWNIPNWRGNSTTVSEDDTDDDTDEDTNTKNETDTKNKTDNACACDKHIMDDGSTRGCAECDEYWDMPSLVGF